MKLDINNYPGSKGGSGVAQWIINHIPESDYFIEGFAGSGKIGRELIKNGCTSAVVFCEKYQPVFEQLQEKISPDKNCEYVFIKHIDTVEFYLNEASWNLSYSQHVFYFDPPYFKEVRKDTRNMYGEEWEESDHTRFFKLVHLLNELGASIIISHYDCDLYNTHLDGWKTDTMKTMTRGGVAEEKIWMNYDIQELNLAVSCFLGKNSTDRQRIKRRKESFLKKFMEMPVHERQAILEHIQNSL